MQQILGIIIAVLLLTACEDSNKSETTTGKYKYSSIIGEENTVLIEGGVEVPQSEWHTAATESYNEHQMTAEDAKMFEFELSNNNIVVAHEGQKYNIPYTTKGNTIYKQLVDEEGETLETPFAIKNSDGLLEMHLMSFYIFSTLINENNSDWNMQSTQEHLADWGMSTNLPEGTEVYHFRTKFLFKKVD